MYEKCVCVCKSFLKNIQETGNNSIWGGEGAGSEIQTKKETWFILHILFVFLIHVLPEFKII